jgi:hypothetical protein
MTEFRWIEIIGYAGTLATIATYAMRTILPLRIAAIFSSVFFITYASIVGIWPMLATGMVILPLNCVRLYQMLKTAKRVRELPASGGATAEEHGPVSPARACHSSAVSPYRAWPSPPAAAPSIRASGVSAHVASAARPPAAAIPPAA